jgi:hypothetical protein
VIFRLHWEVWDRVSLRTPEVCMTEFSAISALFFISCSICEELPAFRRERMSYEVWGNNTGMCCKVSGTFIKGSIFSKIYEYMAIDHAFVRPRVHNYIFGQFQWCETFRRNGSIIQLLYSVYCKYCFTILLNFIINVIVYIYNYRRYRFGLLGLISVVLMSRMKVTSINSYLWCLTNIYIYIYIFII